MAKEIIEVASPLYHACGTNLFKILPETTAEQVRVSGVSLREHLEGISRAIAGSSVFRFVNSIPERNLLTNLNVGDRVYVTDASADPEINQAVPASYIWMPTHEWRQIGQAAPPDMNDYVLTGGGLAVNSQGKVKLSAMPFERGLLANTEEILTTSGEYTVKASGWHEVTVIGGGASGGFAYGTEWHIIFSGHSGAIERELVYLVKGQKVPVEIGAGGQAVAGANNNVNQQEGGNTSFGSVTTLGSPKRLYGADIQAPAQYSMSARGGGLGAADWQNPPSYYGGGGAGYCDAYATAAIVTNGYQGAVILRYHDPDKDSVEEEE